ELKDFFPPDFVVEYTGQIRAWFFVLHIIANALYQSNAYKNVVVTGVILGTDGRKMSKNFGNYPDPKEMLAKYGGDALRLYLMGTPVMKGEDILISEEQYRNQVKNFLLIFWNTYNYFVTYSNLNNWRPSNSKTESKNILDKWILASTQKLINITSMNLERYDTVSYIENLQNFLTELSTWYLRRSRGRKDNNFYATFYHVLVEFCKLSAPIAPFITEEIYKNLTKEDSIHLSDWPKSKALTKDEEKILKQMDDTRKIVEKAHYLRKEAGIPLRQPLQKLALETLYPEFIDLMKDELNVKEIVKGKKMRLDTKINDELKAEGEMREIVRKIQQERKNLRTTLDEKVKVTLPDWPKDFEDEIKSRALVSSISKGPFKVERIVK